MSLQYGLLVAKTRHKGADTFVTVVPWKMREKILHQFHRDPEAVHRSHKPMIERIRGKYYWPGLSRDVRIYCERCLECRVSKLKSGLKQGKLKIWELTPEKFKIIHVDFTGAGALPVTREGNREILMIVDRYSSWLVAVPVENGTAKTVVKTLIERWFPYYRTTDRIITDRGADVQQRTHARTGREIRG